MTFYGKTSLIVLTSGGQFARPKLTLLFIKDWTKFAKQYFYFFYRWTDFYKDKNHKVFVNVQRSFTMLEKPNWFIMDDIDIQSVIDSWRWRCRKACECS